MKLVIIFGPQAVGKMTVGQELMKLTDLKLFHNHMTIDLVGNFFDYGTEEGKKLVAHFRNEIFESVSKSNLKGLIFTYVWAFDMQSDWDYINQVRELFLSQGAEVYFVELEANVEERLLRNRTENRLEHKPSKRNLEWSDNDLKNSVVQYRLNSLEGELDFPNYMRIDNTNLSANEVALRIKEEFKL